MTINKNAEGSKLTLALEGRLDSTTAPELQSVIKESVDGIEELTIDMTDLEYVSSAGLRVLISAHKAMRSKGGMTVTNVNEIVMEVFEITGFAEILNIQK